MSGGFSCRAEPTLGFAPNLRLYLERFFSSSFIFSMTVTLS